VSSHLLYVAAAYGAAGAIIACLIAWSVLSLRRERRLLGELEQRLGRGPRV
jgi:heme exporter protein CcmD